MHPEVRTVNTWHVSPNYGLDSSMPCLIFSPYFFIPFSQTTSNTSPKQLEILSSLTNFTGRGFLASCVHHTTMTTMGRSVSILFALVCVLGISAEAVFVGGPRPIGNFANDLEVEKLANFAVDQYKSRLNSVSDISFSKVVAAQEQVVQGTMYFLTIEVLEGGVPKLYDAKVWVKSWENFQELESFLPSGSSHFNAGVDVSTASGDIQEREQIGA